MSWASTSVPSKRSVLARRLDEVTKNPYQSRTEDSVCRFMTRSRRVEALDVMLSRRLHDQWRLRSDATLRQCDGSHVRVFELFWIRLYSGYSPPKELRISEPTFSAQFGSLMGNTESKDIEEITMCAFRGDSGMTQGVARSRIGVKLLPWDVQRVTNGSLVHTILDLRTLESETANEMHCRI